MTVTWDPFAPGLLDDPHPTYAALRRQGRVQQSQLGMWTLWRHAQVDGFLRSGTSVDEDLVDPPTAGRVWVEQQLGRPRPRPIELTMLEMDEPDHGRLRRLVAKAFTPRSIARLQPTVEALVDASLDAIEEAGEVDLVDALAFPLPFAVISQMLGMPDVDTDVLRHVSGLVVSALEPLGDIELLREIGAAQTQMHEMVADAIAWKREHPADDVLTALIAAESDGDRLTEDELVRQVGLLYLAGHETTVNLVGGGVLALLQAPEQLELLRATEVDCVDELLRFVSPVQLTRRVTLEDVDVDGTTIPRASLVVLSIASANRDEAVFGSDADELHLDRPSAREHVAFAAGTHHCLGASLARLEARAAVPRLVRRFPRLALAGEPTMNGRMNLRGPSHLPVSVR